MHFLERLGIAALVFGAITGAGFWFLWPVKPYTLMGDYFKWPYNTRSGLFLQHMHIRYSHFRVILLRGSGIEYEEPTKTIIPLQGGASALLQFMGSQQTALKFWLRGSRTVVQVRVVGKNGRLLLQRWFDLDTCAHCCVTEVVQQVSLGKKRLPKLPHKLRSYTEATLAQPTRLFVVGVRAYFKTRYAPNPPA